MRQAGSPTLDMSRTINFYDHRCEKVNIEALLIASGQNVKRLLAFGGRRPKKPAQAAALRPPSATEHEISGAREHRSNCSWRPTDRKSTRLNSSHANISYAVFCLKKNINVSRHGLFFFFNDTPTPEIYTLSLPDALPIFY